MRDRPIYVGLICIYLILANSYSLVKSFQHLNSPAMKAQIADVPLPAHVQKAKYVASLAVPLVCAIFMWEGANWARVVFIAWLLINYTTDAILVRDKMPILYQGPFMPKLAILTVCALILMLPAPRGYFQLPRHHS